MNDGDTINTLAVALVEELIAANRRVATAESCTGGWIAKAITDVAGSSACFAYGIVSYSDDAKSALLGVSPDTLSAHGAVSEPVVREMAAGVLELSGADLTVAVSGIAGPDGGSEEKPVGTVWFGWQGGAGNASSARVRFEGDRDAVRRQTVITALQGLREQLRDFAPA